MSRSIHTTRRTLRDLRKKKFASAEDRQAALKKARSEIWKKRRIKRQVAEERGRENPPLAVAAVGTIPVEVWDTGPFVQHGASEADVRAILALLPSAACEGIASIRLCLGREYMEERADDDDDERDPFTGRKSFEIFPRVYAGDVLGTYSFKVGRIAIYAFVFDPAKLPLSAPLCTFYLRLHALKTFVHEVAHHHDEVCRKARGRWRADREENSEWYAEKMEYEWTHEIVLPYLERTYPKEARALRRWVAHRGGLLLPLAFFAGDCRTTERNGMVRLVSSTSSAFETLVSEVTTAGSLAESRLGFAWDLHFADAYEDCLAILEKLLARAPEWIEALTCQADTLVHLERLDEALAVAEKVLHLEPANAEARESRGDVFERRKDWAALLENCARWERSGTPPHMAMRDMLLHRAVAHCALGDEVAMRASFEANLALRQSRSAEAAQRHALALFRGIHRRAGRPLPEKIPAPG